MKLTRFQIENFRGIESLDLALDKTTVLIGENNAGKSSVLEALNICMTRGLGRRALPFGEFDYRLADGTSDPREAPPIILTLTFEEAHADEWPVAVVQSFPNVVQVQDDGRHLLAFRVQAQFDHALNEYTVDWFFLDRNASPLPSARNPKLVTDLQAIAPVFLLSAMRDASQHFNARSPFWAPFTRSMVMSDEQRVEIEEHLARVNQSVLDGNEPFREVKEGLAKTGRVLPLGPILYPSRPCPRGSWTCSLGLRSNWPLLMEPGCRLGNTVLERRVCRSSSYSRRSWRTCWLRLTTRTRSPCLHLRSRRPICIRPP